MTCTNFSHRECITFTRQFVLLVIFRVAGRYTGYNTRSLMDAILLSNTGYLISMIKRHSIEQVQQRASSCLARKRRLPVTRYIQSLSLSLSRVRETYLIVGFLILGLLTVSRSKPVLSPYLCNCAAILTILLVHTP